MRHIRCQAASCASLRLAIAAGFQALQHSRSRLTSVTRSAAGRSRSWADVRLRSALPLRAARCQMSPSSGTVICAAAGPASLVDYVVGCHEHCLRYHDAPSAWAVLRFMMNSNFVGCSFWRYSIFCRFRPLMEGASWLVSFLAC
jgi:hypothetical protein